MIKSLAMSNLLNPIGNTVKFCLAALIIMVIAIGSGSKAQAAMPGRDLESTPPPSPNCIGLLLNMSDCLGYVESGSNLTEPDKGCCPELAGLLESNSICFCQLLGSPGRKTGLTIQLNKALHLPSLCNLHSPPTITFCQDAGIPVGSPIASEPPSPTPSGDMASEGLASPSTTDDNGGLSLAITSLSLFAGLASAIFFLPISSD